MKLLVVLLLSLLLHFGRATGHSNVGGGRLQDIHSQEVVDAATAGVRLLNQQSNAIQSVQLVKIIQAYRQLVAGFNYRLKVKVGLSKCPNDSSVDTQTLDACPVSGDLIEYELTVWDQAWRTPRYTLTDFKQVASADTDSESTDTDTESTALADKDSVVDDERDDLEQKNSQSISSNAHFHVQDSSDSSSAKTCLDRQSDEISRCAGMVGCFITQCDEDGRFSPLQCWGSTGSCWCVDEIGEKLPYINSPSMERCKKAAASTHPTNNAAVLIVPEHEIGPWYHRSAISYILFFVCLFGVLSFIRSYFSKMKVPSSHEHK